jgi:predicted kinase
MSTDPPQRSVRIDDDERGGWSSDRPRSGNAPRRPADVSVRGRVLTPTDRIRYSPGSLLLITAADAAERDRFAQKVLEDPKLLLSFEKVRALLEGRVPEEELDTRAGELLETAIVRRLEAGETVVVAPYRLAAEEREYYVRLAAEHRRPRHLILLEVAADKVSDEDRAELNQLRRTLEAGELGNEGFHSALRLGGGSAFELRRILFRNRPKED